MSSPPLLYSVLDLCPILEGGSAGEAFRHSVRLAQQAESSGYHRYWFAEHHSIPGVASAATSVVIAHVAGATQTIRVGSGGIMLPNHAPLVIAEQFGTLEALFPGRIDLGLGRAPGGDQASARALRRTLGSNGDTFPQDVMELLGYLAPGKPGSPVIAIPGQGAQVPIYLLGSSTFSAQFAARIGVPFAFASHFAPDSLHAALDLYRRDYTPSRRHPDPHVIVAVNVIAADTDDEAQRLFTTLQQLFLNLVRGHPRRMPPPIENIDDLWTPQEQRHVQRMLQYSVVGGPDTLRRGLQQILSETQADELIAVMPIYDLSARLHSLKIAAKVFQDLAVERSSSTSV